MRWSSRVATALAVLAAVALTAVGVWFSSRGTPPGAAQGEAAAIDASQASPTADVYPLPPIGTVVPPLRTIPPWEPTPTCTPGPFVQTAEAVMALPTWTPRPPPTATPVPTPVVTLPPTWSVVLLSGVHQGREVPALLRLPVDAEGHAVADADVLNVGYLGSGPYAITGLVPSPDDRRVLVSWTYGDAGWGASVLDVVTGVLGPSLAPGEGISVKAWHPDGMRVLMQRYLVAAPQEPVLLDITTGERSALPVPTQELPTWEISSASFSPDGSEVVLAYTVTDGRSYRSEVWRCSLASTCALLHQSSTSRVDHVSWSPRGDWIAMRQFTLPGDDAPWDRVGELWLLHPSGGKRIEVGPAFAGGGDWYSVAPKWSHSGEQLAYLGGGQRPSPAGPVPDTSIHLWSADTGVVRTLVGPEGGAILALSWAPDDRSLLHLQTQLDEGRDFLPVRVDVSTTQTTPVVLGEELGVHFTADSAALWLGQQEVR